MPHILNLGYNFTNPNNLTNLWRRETQIRSNFVMNKLQYFLNVQICFLWVLTFNISKLITLNYRCLEPGKYASHIERWLQFYKSQQLLIIDGEKLKSDPIYVMNKLQHFLNVQPIVDYEKLLKYDSTKGFYCPITCEYFWFA